MKINKDKALETYIRENNAGNGFAVGGTSVTLSAFTLELAAEADSAVAVYSFKVVPFDALVLLVGDSNGPWGVYANPSEVCDE